MHFRIGRLRFAGNAGALARNEREARNDNLAAVASYLEKISCACEAVRARAPAFPAIDLISVTNARCTLWLKPMAVPSIYSRRGFVTASCRDLARLTWAFVVQFENMSIRISDLMKGRSIESVNLKRTSQACPHARGHDDLRPFVTRHS